ncbi:MAG: insulinase family protein [Phycisphaerales bacterium]|nr:MAG: insulinase family protein [Phycisphaerales bacterium]
MLSYKRPGLWAAATQPTTFLAVGLVGSALGILPSSAATRSGDVASEAIKKIRTVEGITEYALENGLQVLLFPDQSKPTVTVNVTYYVGSRHEGRGETGMAHLLEHMVFKGTPTYENIWGVLEDHGGTFNGSTWMDRTNYFETLPASDENLKFALHMEADRMVNSLIDAEEFATEMTVVRNEFEMRENYPTNVLTERMMSSAYLWHNYGKSTVGNRSDIERVPVERLREFYRKYYQPDNATLLVAGRFDMDSTLELINKYFGAIPRPTRVLDATYTIEPIQDGSRSVVLKRVGDVSAAGLLYHIPAGIHPDFPAVQVLEDILTSEPAGRLYKALVEPGTASYVWGNAFPWAEPGRMFLMSEAQLDKDIHEILDRMIDVVEGVSAAGITDEEVARAKTRHLKHIKMAMTNSGRIGVRIGEWAALGDWRLFFIHRDRLKAVTTADVQRVAQKYLLESNRTSGLFIPTKEPKRAEIPASPSVAEMVKDYTGSESIEMGEAFAATPENIEKRTQRIAIHPGMKVALLSKETRGDAVRARFNFHFGTEEGLTGHRTALELMPDLLMRGTQSKDYQQLRDEIDRLQSRINLHDGVATFSASIESDRANVVAAIELLGEILQRPAFAPNQFEILVKENLTGLEEALSDPQTLAFTTIRRALNPWPKGHIHYVSTIAEEIEQIKAVSLGTLKDLHARYYGGSNAEISVVGDFDADEVAATIKRVFGSWKSPTAYKRIVKPHRTVEAKSETINTPDKKMAMIATGTVFEMRDDDPDYPALAFAAYCLGESAKSRLITRLRFEEGLSYGAGSTFQALSKDARAAILGYAMCPPAKAAQAQEAMREEIARWIAGGLTDEEMSAGRTACALQFENMLANDLFVVYMLADGLEIDRTMLFWAKVIERIRSLTKEEIQAALKKHLGNAKFPEIRAGDLAQAETKE